MPAPTGSANIKLRKKLKIANGISKDDKKSGINLDSNGKGVRRSKREQNRETESYGVSHSGGNVSSKKGIRVKSTVTSNAAEEVYEGALKGKSGISGGKRKRVYAHRDMDKEGTLEDSAGSSRRRSSLKSYRTRKLDLETQDKFSDPRESRKKTLYGEARRSNNSKLSEQSTRKMNLERQEKFFDSRESKKKPLYGEGRRSNNCELANERNSRKVKEIREVKYVKVDGYEEEENGKRKSKERKALDQNRSKQKAESPSRFSRKKVQDRKSLGADSDVYEQRPKKKKQDIRIDPHDTSNKRLDDGLPSKDKNKEKQEDSAKDKTVELSKNAQFRAIRPSPSILSFVEDNLLGRRRDIQLKRAGYNIELSAPLDNIPFSTSSERERIEEPVFRNKLEFFAAAKVSSSFPPADLPEIAFAGRSNVGKSSLLNALTRQWGVVRTSDKPGLTQAINFFNLGSKMCLVDLPGYGFAYAKEEVKEAWEELVKEYVSTRLGLKRVCLLIDTKWGMKPRDHELIDLMERAQTKYQIILTKTDTVFPIDVARRAMQIEESLKTYKSVVQPVVMISSKSGAGIRSLRTVLSKIARFVKP
ncbi:PREDICTED: methyl-CpG-binding domain-containing protein 13 [Nicotiana attenuata]|uniref:Gtp-binding protein n=1 Tax=Nicotiana attenuata TaxID=49451 RepID=A0A1J6I8K9_NICAT|nr:PREDICTED: methyl-CpG-binding domain-containing protein 13 [Nicotiana attenuata]OIT00780.1 gtp-binding protein [Nicotiana attenuata]